MTATLFNRACLGSRRALVGGVVVVMAMLISMPSAHAQDVDSSRAEPSAVEPAELDSLPGGGLASPEGPPGWTPSPDTGDAGRVRVNADSLSALQQNGERIQELFGNVFVQQDTTELRSNYARRYLNRDEVLFVEDVVVYERGDTLRADTVRYDQETEVGRAFGNVYLTDGEVTVRSDRGIYFASEKRSVFPDSVILSDSARTLRAAYGTYWSNDRRAEFGGGVQLTQPGTTIHSDSLIFYRDRDRSIAVGNVFIDRQGTDGVESDSTTRTYLFGDRADNREQRRYSRVDGDALLVQLRRDSAGASTDTLVVGADRLEAFRTDTHRRLVALNSVRIWQPSLAAVADSVVYDRVVATTTDTTGQTVPIDTTRPPRDSLFALASDSSLSSTASDGDTVIDSSATVPPSDSAIAVTRAPTPDTSTSISTPGPDSTGSPPEDSSTDEAAAAWPTPTAESEDQLPLEEIRLYRSPMTWLEGSQVWADSIRVYARNRQPDTVFVRGNAFAAQRDSVLDRIQQLQARNLTAFFWAGSLRRIEARPNARAIRFLAAENDSLNGAAQTSGDRIEMRFVGGEVRRISVIGGVETTYYREPENIPTPFRLDGFQWVPEREPTRESLLDDERVDRWLDLSVPPPRDEEPVARRDSLMRPPGLRDSTASGIPRGARPAINRYRRPGADSLGVRRSVPADSIPAPPLPPPASADTSKHLEPSQ